MRIGMRIPPKILAQGMDTVVQWSMQVGIDFLDVKQLTSEVIVACQRGGMPIGSVDAQGIPQILSLNESKRSEALESLKLQMSEMSRNGSHILFLLLVPEDKNLPREQGFGIWKETFQELILHAEQENIYMAIEGWPGPGPQYPALGCTPEMLRAMFNAIPSKYLALNYDPSHLVRLGIDYIRFLHEFGERVVHCHGKDTEIMQEELYEYGILPTTFGSKYVFSEGSWRYTIPGDGVVQWEKIATRLHQMNYKGAISIELEDHRYWGSLQAEQNGVIKSREFLEKAFH